ncbi:MAG: phytanoyl-CoA dioxygenase family protein [Candidatus Handelsmanbacteria bacterium]|nr:phytanoyl-CoA dioxygenase family protein [Candidatus Handelsmanbacteria bacterium]
MSVYTPEQVRQWAAQVDERGYATIPGVLSEEELVFLRGTLDHVYAIYDPEKDGLQKVAGYHFSANLVNKSPFFETMFLRNPVYDIAKAILGEDCILSSLNSFEPLKGQGNQNLHRDGPPRPSEGTVALNSMWSVDGMDRDNGATRLIPGSHLHADPPPAEERGIIYADAAPGSVVVTNAHILHAASANPSGRRRRVMHGYFTRRGREQQTKQRQFLSAEVQARLSPLARRVLAIDP